MASYNDRIQRILIEERDNAPEELEHYFIKFEDFWERKLWHELTDSLIDFYSQEKSSPQRIALFESFIKTFAEKINQLRLVELAIKTASQFSDDEKRLSFISTIAKRVDKIPSQDAFVYVTVAQASIKLKMNDSDSAREDLDKCEKILETFDSVETVVHAAFYRVSSEYYKIKNEFGAYYKNALLYLACIELSNLTADQRQTRAYDLSIAALVSDTIYNFGELLLHPILDSLTDSPHAWLRELLFAYNSGDLAAYDRLAPNLAKNMLLTDRRHFLFQKISLAALTEAIFRRPPHDRAMRFQTISEETKVQPDEIEHLIMKALSLGLLRGTIDQVAHVAQINWVQPKVLDLAQIENMRVRLTEWDANVNQLGNWIEGIGKDVWAA